MSCCNGTTKEAFLIQKGKNFKEYILKYSPTEDVLQYMEKFNEQNLFSSIMTLLIPIKATGTADMVITELMGKLTIPPDEMNDVKVKIGRYFDMFTEIMLKTA